MHHYDQPGGRDLTMEVPRVKRYGYRQSIHIPRTVVPVFYTSGAEDYCDPRGFVVPWKIPVTPGHVFQVTSINLAMDEPLWIPGTGPGPDPTYEFQTVRLNRSGDVLAQLYEYTTLVIPGDGVTIRDGDELTLCFNGGNLAAGAVNQAATVTLEGKLVMMERGTWPYPDPRLEAGPRGAPMYTGGAGPIDPAPVSDPGAVPIGGGVQRGGGHVDSQRDSVDVTRPVG